VSLISSSDSETLVRCHGVGKRFCRDLKRSLWYGVQDMTRDFMGLEAPADPADAARPSLRPQEFWAVDGISFELRRGQCLGLIGRNGAGKTTILKMLGGLIKPDCGEIELRGSVGGLIALGAGFNPLLTGRENTYVNGAILGLSRSHIASKMEEIEAFAEIGEFMDAPVQGYSSGMSVRLGFAIAAILTKPDILLLDEVLAVGDMGFTIKCLNAVREMASRSAVIFVSHNMQFISSFCTDVMVLKGGRVSMLTRNLGDGIGAYMACFDTRVGISGAGEASVEKVQVLATSSRNGSGLENLRIQQGAHATVEFDLLLPRADCDHSIHLQIDDQTTTPVMCLPDIGKEHAVERDDGRTLHYSIPLGPLELNAGSYALVIAVMSADYSRCLVRLQGACSFTVTAEKVYWGTIVRHLQASGKPGLDSLQTFTPSVKSL